MWHSPYLTFWIFESRSFSENLGPLKTFKKYVNPIVNITAATFGNLYYNFWSKGREKSNIEWTKTVKESENFPRGFKSLIETTPWKI